MFGEGCILGMKFESVHVFFLTYTLITSVLYISAFGQQNVFHVALGNYGCSCHSKRVSL